MSDRLRVRLYNVRFGDAILVTVPDRDPATQAVTTRHILIDVGNVLNKEGGDDTVFKPIVDDVIAELGGKPLDLYVMTHEHLDHVQGLFYYASKHSTVQQLKQTLNVQYAWLTASSETGYYQNFPNAEKQKKAYIDAYAKIAAAATTLTAAETAPLAALLANNDPRSTDPCVEFLRTLAAAANTSYVYRGFATAGRSPFREATFEIWAPEQDTSDYYHSLLPMADVAARAVDATNARDPLPPAGVDAGAFQDLVEARRNGMSANLLSIDKAANNTSIVFVLTWRGHKLLFSGDAELASWKKMQSFGVLRPVDFVKVSHHGSHNGTPADSILEAYLPAQVGSANRKAVISTWTDTYGGIPDTTTNARIAQRCTLTSMLDDKTVKFIDTFFDG